MSASSLIVVNCVRDAAQQFEGHLLVAQLPVAFRQLDAVAVSVVGFDAGPPPPIGGPGIILQHAAVDPAQVVHHTHLDVAISLVHLEQMIQESQPRTPLAGIRIDDIPEVLANVLLVVPTAGRRFLKRQIERLGILQRRRVPPVRQRRTLLLDQFFDLRPATLRAACGADPPFAATVLPMLSPWQMRHRQPRRALRVCLRPRSH